MDADAFLVLTQESVGKYCLNPMAQMAGVSGISSPSIHRMNTSRLLTSELEDGLTPLDFTQTTNPVCGWEGRVVTNAT